MAGTRKMRPPYRPTTYEPEKHIPLLRKMFKEGKSLSAYTTAVDIVPMTFYDWVNKYPEFAEAYEKANQEAQVYWEDYAFNNASIPGFNYSYWFSTMVNRFDYTSHRKLKVKDITKAETATDKYNVVLKEIEQGRITGHELKQLVDAIVSSVKIAEITDLAKEIEILKEQVKEQS